MGTRTGDLVWAHVHGYPWWPGQVMDPSNATDKARKKQEAGKVLISFFGDNSFGWFAQIELLPFSAAYAEKKQQTPQTKIFIRAVEEAKEVQDRRQGLQPATDHNPWDFLAPEVEDKGESESESDQLAGRRGTRPDLRPPEAQQQHAQQCSADKALAWLQALALGQSTAQWQPAQAEAAKLLTFSALRAKANPAKKRGRPRRPTETLQEERSPARPVISPRGRQKKAAQKAGDAVESLMVLQHDSYEGSNDPPPHQLEAETVLLAHAEVSDEGSEAMGDSDGEAKSKQPAVIEGGDESVLLPETDEHMAAAVALATLKSEPLHELAGQAAKEAEQQPPEEPITLPSFSPELLLQLLRALAANPSRFGRDSHGVLGVCSLRWRESAYCRSDIHRKLCLGRLLQRELHNSSMQALVENGIQDEAQGKAAELAELQGLLRPPRSRKRRSSVVAEDEYMPKRRRGSTGGGIRVEEPVIEKEARWYDYQDLIPSSPAAFFRELNGLYIMHGAPTDPAVTVNHAPLDMHALFLAVAQRGGYSAATLQRQWSYIGGSLHEKWAPASTIIRKHYLRYLLAFEQALTQEADYTLVRNDYGKRGRSSTGAADDTPRRASADGRASAGAFLDSRVKREEGKRVKREDSGYGGDRDKPKSRLKVSKPQPVRVARPVLQEASLSDGGSDMEDAGSASKDSEELPQYARQQHPNARKPAIHNPRRPAVGPPQAVGTSRIAHRVKAEPTADHTPAAVDSSVLQKLDSMLEPVAVKVEQKPPVRQSEQGTAPGGEQLPMAPSGKRVVRDTLLLRFPQEYHVPTKAQVLIRLRKFNVIENDDAALRVSDRGKLVVARFPNERCARQAEAAAGSSADAWFSMPKGSTRASLEVFRPPQPRAAADKLAPQAPARSSPAAAAANSRPAAAGSLKGTAALHKPITGSVKPPARTVLAHHVGQVMRHSQAAQQQQEQQPQPKPPADPRKPAPVDPRRARAATSQGGAGVQAQPGPAAPQVARSAAAAQPPADPPSSHTAAQPAASAGIDLLSILKNAGIDPGLQQPPAAQPAAPPPSVPASSFPMQAGSSPAWRPPPPRPPPSAVVSGSSALDIGGQLLGLLGQLQQ